jgi:hypothetical protein
MSSCVQFFFNFDLAGLQPGNCLSPPPSPLGAKPGSEIMLGYCGGLPHTVQENVGDETVVSFTFPDSLHVTITYLMISELIHCR